VQAKGDITSDGGIEEPELIKSEANKENHKKSSSSDSGLATGSI
jgi:hypothetical protein